MKLPLRACLCLIASPLALAQIGGPQVIGPGITSPKLVYAADLDGDGDLDVLSGSHASDTIAWNANLGNGNFGPLQIISNQMFDLAHMTVFDMDGDGDQDVLTAGKDDELVAWLENDGAGGGWTQHIITDTLFGACAVMPADLNGDGLMDVLYCSCYSDDVLWSEGLGAGLFGPPQLIDDEGDYPQGLAAADLDGDGDIDIAVASTYDDTVAWFENLGGGQFGPRQVLNPYTDGANVVRTADIDGDGDVDILVMARFDEVAWHENLGGGNFAGRVEITTHVNDEPKDLQLADLDGDGDLDLLWAEYGEFWPFPSSVFGWTENHGGGVFGPDLSITHSADGVSSVFAADLDGDGQADLLTASGWDHEINWYHNNFPLGVNYCQATPNSTGTAPALSATGSRSLMAQDLELQMSAAPPGQAAIFFVGPDSSLSPLGDGFLCVGGGLVRLGPPVLETSGTFVQPIDFGQHATALGVLGTGHFQCWYRDPSSSGTPYNLSDGLALIFTP